MSARQHADAPHNQPFNIRGKHSLKRGWWLRGSNNAKKGSHE